jgi:hypothetical protein
MAQTNGRLDAHFGFHSGQIESQWIQVSGIITLHSLVDTLLLQVVPYATSWALVLITLHDCVVSCQAWDPLGME